MDAFEPGLCRGCDRPTEIPGAYWHRGCLAAYRASKPYRQAALDRDGHNCAACTWLRNRLTAWAYAYRWQHTPRWLRSRVTMTRPVQVDHINPLALTGTHDLWNLQTLCIRHHQRKTRHDLARIKEARMGNIDGGSQNWVRAMDNATSGRLARPGTREPRRTGQRPPSGTNKRDGHGWPPAIIGWLFSVLVVTGLALWLHWPARDVVGGLAITLPFALGHSILWGIKVRLWDGIAPALFLPASRHPAMRATRWRVRNIIGLRLPRLRPTHIRIKYPRTFPDHDDYRTREVEARISAKCGGTWRFVWNTQRDRMDALSPDPLEGAGGKPWPLMDAERTNLWDGVPVGVGEDGQTVTMGLVGKHLLIGGETGAGKSVSLSMIVAAAALDPDVVMHGIDGKGLVELAPWGDVWFDLVENIASAIEMLRELIAVIDGRYAMLQIENKRKVEPGDGMGLHILVVDELARFTAGMGTKQERDEFARLLADILARGRAAGVVVVMATQRPAADVVPTSIRDLVGYRWALRCATPQTSDMVLGQGHASTGADASRIAAESRGMGWVLAEGSKPFRLRSFLLTDGDVALLAGRAARLRVGPVEPEGATADADEPSPST